MKTNFSQEEVLRMFYLCGAVIFLVVGIANTFTNAHYWPNMILSAKVSAIFSNIFNYVLAVFFYFLLKGMKAGQVKPLADKTLDQIFKEASK